MIDWNTQETTKENKKNEPTTNALYVSSTSLLLLAIEILINIWVNSGLLLLPLLLGDFILFVRDHGYTM